MREKIEQPKTSSELYHMIKEIIFLQNNLIADLSDNVLKLEAQKNGAYSERTKTLSGMCSMAIALGYCVYIMPHVGEEWDDDWRNIVVIEGPTGQMSWHIHDSEMELFKGMPHVSENKWDGHDTEEKYRRVIGLSECVPAMRRYVEANIELRKNDIWWQLYV